MPSFFLSQAPARHSFTFNLRFLCEVKHKVCLSIKPCVRFLIFNSISFLWFLYFLYFTSTKCMNSLNLKRHNSFQNQNNGKVTHNFPPRSLNFKLQQKVLKFNKICVNWRYLEIDLVINYLILESQSFDNVPFSQ